jgi:deoxyadenosine/deoxycytidine kinase
MHPILINIDGIIGVGKTTFINKLKKIFTNCSFIDENVSEWINIYNNNDDNILNRFYTNMSRYSFTFQNFVFIQKYMSLLDKIKEGNQFIFMDRSSDTDRYVFAKIQHDNKNMSDIEWNIYNKWCDTISIYLNNFKQKVIYLQCNPSVALTRIKKRGRIEEKSISLEYLIKLHIYHENLMNLYDNDDKIVIDYNDDMTDDETNKFIDKISVLIYNKFLS